MKLQTSSGRARSSRLFLITAWAGLVGSLCFGADTPAAKVDQGEKTAPEEKTGSDYRNWFDVSVGGWIVNGDRAQFMRRQGVPAGPFGGISDFHWEEDVGKKGLFSIDGRGIFDNHDYDIKFSLENPDIGYLRGGFRESRTWYDGSGGYFPKNGAWISLYNEELAIDRGEAWFEGGLTLKDAPQLHFRYSHEFRHGQKDSTEWGDTTLTGGYGTRAIVPTFLDIDERRDIFQFDFKHMLGNTDFGAGVSYELDNNNDSRNINRRPGEPSDRYVTQKEGVKSDIFSAHAFTETRFNDQFLFTTGYAFTTLDTDISGSRIYGSDYDPLYDPTFSRRQARDEGFFDLSGGSEMKQYVLNMNLMWTPMENLTIVPAIRVEKQDQDGSANYTETAVGSAPTLTTVETGIFNTRHRDFLDVSESLEARYSGITNWAFYTRGEWLEGNGQLNERESESATGFVARDTDNHRLTQKYIAGANWYPLKKANFAGQYYYKLRANSYDHNIDSTSNALASPDRYPAFLRDQDFATHDLNFRVTWRPLKNLTSVTRYDFQLSTIETRPDNLAEIQSAESTSHIISESISWAPLARLFLQGSINYVWDQTDTPAANAISGTNLVLNSKNDYWNASFMAGYALTEKTDLQAQYIYYRADNYQDNSQYTQPYGAGAEEQGVTATLIHRFSQRMQWTLRYGFFTNHDQTSGGHNDYNAHLVFTSMRYLF